MRELQQRFERFESNLDLSKKRERLRTLEIETAKPSLWDSPEEARKLMQELSDLQTELTEIDNLREEINALTELNRGKEVNSDLEADSLDSLGS